MDRGIAIRESYTDKGEISILDCYQNPINKEWRPRNLQDALRLAYEHMTTAHGEIVQLDLKSWVGTSDDIRPTGLRSRIRNFLIKLACMV